MPHWDYAAELVLIAATTGEGATLRERQRRWNEARQLVVTMPHAVPIRSVRLRPNRGWCASCAITVSWRCMHLTLTALPISVPPRTARNLPLCVKSHTGRSSTVRTPDQAAGHEPARYALDLAALTKHCLKLATSTRVESSADPNTPCEPTRWPRHSDLLRDEQILWRLA
jgi:hypothetical protein